jgi:hypothetical protein
VPDVNVNVPMVWPFAKGTDRVSDKTNMYKKILLFLKGNKIIFIMAYYLAIQTNNH